jgi:hypothetical protein
MLPQQDLKVARKSGLGDDPVTFLLSVVFVYSKYLYKVN